MTVPWGLMVLWEVTMPGRLRVPCRGQCPEGDSVLRATVSLGVTVTEGLGEEAGTCLWVVCLPRPERTVPLDQRFGQQAVFQLPQLARAGEDEEGGGVAGEVHVQHGALQLGVVRKRGRAFCFLMGTRTALRSSTKKSLSVVALGSKGCAHPAEGERNAEITLGKPENGLRGGRSRSPWGRGVPTRAATPSFVTPSWPVLRYLCDPGG